jgi:5-methylcytosine-specific restriction endonuclease McrA
MKAYRTKELEIPKAVKLKVANRDSVDGWACCILCGKPAPTSYPLAFSCCHYIPRSQGGLGIEENILTLCWDCHLKFDQSTEQSKMKEFFRKYLQSKYPEWDEENLVYKKENDYE